jgi:hypothetical protein
MAAVRVRLIGGALNGQVLWVEENRASVDVNVGGGAGAKKSLRYRIDGAVAVFVAEPLDPAGT